MLTAALIFLATYVVIALGRAPGLRLDRTGAALLGASLMVASGTLTLDQAYKAVDIDTLTLLLGMMIIVAHLRLAGFFQLAAAWVGEHAHRPALLLVGVVLVSGLLSAFLVHHGRIPALGFRVGNAAYTPDLHDIPAESWPALENLDLWIVDGLRYAGHPSHFSVNDALSWIERFKPKRAVITNMHSDLDYEVLRQSLPAGVIPAYDGMRLELG